MTGAPFTPQDILFAVPDIGAFASFRKLILEHPEYELGRCRSCHMVVWWGKRNGRPHPFDFTGQSHLLVCAQAKKWIEKKKGQGDLFTSHGRTP